MSRSYLWWKEIKNFSLDFLKKLDDSNIKYNTIITDSIS